MGYLLYEIRFPNGKKYIGCTASGKPEKRIAQHVQAARAMRLDLPVYRAIRKYHAAGMEWSVIGSFETEAEMLAGERKAIAEQGTCKPGGYNLSGGGEGGVPHPETRAKLSAAHKGRKRPPRSMQWRANISASKMGHVVTEEHRAKLRVPKTSEHRAKLSASLKKYHAS